MTGAAVTAVNTFFVRNPDALVCILEQLLPIRTARGLRHKDFDEKDGL